jgi:polygalacturonase
MENITLDNRMGDAPNSRSEGRAAGHNTDGFGFASSDNVILRDSNIWNQDDCVAITSGTNIKVSGLYCHGGHGLSIGSVGGKSSKLI